MRKILLVALFLLFLASPVWGSGGVVSGVPRGPLGTVIANAIERGVLEETIVLLLIFPLIAAMVAFSRQVVGLVGFGMLVPVLVTAAFLSTGVMAGLILFAVIVAAATLARLVLKRVRLPYLPRMAVLVWVVSLAVLGLLIISPNLSLGQMTGLGIFPILLMVMLAESYVEAGITRTWQTAAMMTAETIGIALVGYFIVSSVILQHFVLSNPEWSVVLIFLMDVMVGTYKGLRLMEVWRFRKILNFKF